MTNSVNLDARKSHPRIGVTFGYARIGGYRLYLWNPPETEATEIASGHNGDLIPDEFPIGKRADQLDGFTISVEAAVKSVQFAVDSGEDPSGPYSVTVKITQDGDDVSGSPITYRGNLKEGREAVLEYITMNVTAV